jgi:exonuclease VII small subunit
MNAYEDPNYKHLVRYIRQLERRIAILEASIGHNPYYNPIPHRFPHPLPIIDKLESHHIDLDEHQFN